MNMSYIVSHSSQLKKEGCYQIPYLSCLKLVSILHTLRDIISQQNTNTRVVVWDQVSITFDIYYGKFVVYDSLDSMF